MRRFHPVLMILLLALLLTLAPPLPALADPGLESAAEDVADLHCVLFLVPISEDPETGMITADAVLQGCFTSFEEAVEFGSGGTIELPEGSSPAGLTQRRLDRASALEAATSSSNVLIGEEFDETNFNHGSKLYFASSGCGPNNYQDPNVGAAWNDQFESGKGFASCDNNRKFKHQNFGGEERLCTPNCADYGTLRNEVSSLKWKN